MAFSLGDVHLCFLPLHTIEFQGLNIEHACIILHFDSLSIHCLVENGEITGGSRTSIVKEGK